MNILQRQREDLPELTRKGSKGNCQGNSEKDLIESVYEYGVKQLAFLPLTICTKKTERVVSKVL